MAQGAIGNIGAAELAVDVLASVRADMSDLDAMVAGGLIRRDVDEFAEHRLYVDPLSLKWEGRFIARERSSFIREPCVSWRGR
eukprot:4238169-Pyramimonas_sp.AAC.1